MHETASSTADACGPVLFVADTHLTPEEPEGIERFRTFLAGPVRTLLTGAPGGRLVLLGDLFDFWVSDAQAREPLVDGLLGDLRGLVRLGVDVGFVEGNRDFAAAAALMRAGVTALPDRGVVERGGLRVVFCHGDRLCTRDVRYQALRRVIRAGALRQAVAALPDGLAMRLGRSAREGSRRETSRKAYGDMGLDPAAVAGVLAAEGADAMVCGHVHWGREHSVAVEGVPRRLIVLSAWEERGSYAVLGADGLEMRWWPESPGSGDARGPEIAEGGVPEADRIRESRPIGKGESSRRRQEHGQNLVAARDGGDDRDGFTEGRPTMDAADADAVANPHDVLPDPVSDPAPARAVVVAIDGPAGAGKSTVARRLADSLGYRFLDTGALYRCVALRALRRGLDLSDEGAIAAVAATVRPVFDDRDGTVRVLTGGEDVTQAIRGPDVSNAVSVIAALPAVRAAILPLQRDFVSANGTAGALAPKGVVAEGRDIGTVVFPDADVKVFLTADPEVRARRRATERGERDVAGVLREIRSRDARDTGRAVAPLRAADDAVTVDSTNETIEAVVARIAAIVAHRLDARSRHAGAE